MSGGQVQRSYLSAAPGSRTRRPVKTVEFSTEVYGKTSGYEVKKFTDGSWWCSCPAWRNNHAHPDHRHCKHTRQVQRERGE